MKFFADNSLGLDADLERHRKQERRLRSAIERLSEKSDDEDEINNRIFLEAYSNSLDNLLKSKARLVNKIGRK